MTLSTFLFFSHAGFRVATVPNTITPKVEETVNSPCLVYYKYNNCRRLPDLSHCLNQPLLNISLVLILRYKDLCYFVLRLGYGGKREDCAWGKKMPNLNLWDKASGCGYGQLCGLGASIPGADCRASPSGMAAGHPGHRYRLTPTTQVLASACLWWTSCARSHSPGWKQQRTSTLWRSRLKARQVPSVASE